MRLRFAWAALAAGMLLLAGCGAESLSAPAAPSPTPVTTAAPAPEATAAPAEPEETAPAATAEPAADRGDTRFDPAAADYSGHVLEATEGEFLLSPTVVTRQGSGGNVSVMAEAGPSTAITVRCDDATRYLAIYADGKGSSRQEAGGAAMVGKDAFVYVTGSETDAGFLADTVAILNP